METNRLNNVRIYNPHNINVENNNNRDNPDFFSETDNSSSINRNNNIRALLNSDDDSSDRLINFRIYNPHNINVENNNNENNPNFSFSYSDNSSNINSNNNTRSLFSSDDDSSYISHFLKNIIAQANTILGLNNNNNYNLNERIINFINGLNNNIELNFGRPNQENNGQRCHNKNSFGNARKKIYNSCKLSIYNFIHEFIPQKLRIKLHVPTIEKQIGYSYKNNIKFFQKTIYKIFCDSIPRRVKNEIKNNRSEYNYNKVMIDMLLKQENNDSTKEVKILKLLFNLKFIDFLMVYLNDAVQLNIGDLSIDLKGFKTFGQCFNENRNRYTQSQKNMFKRHIFDIIANKKNNRKPRAKIHGCA